MEHSWLRPRHKYLWIHCKNLEAAKECWDYQAFCHSEDPYTYTSTGKIWLHDISLEVDEETIIPLIDDVDYPSLNGKPYAICTDYPYLLD